MCGSSAVVRGCAGDDEQLWEYRLRNLGLFGRGGFPEVRNVWLK